MAEELFDIEVDIDGDLIVDDSGDLKISTAVQSLIQDVIFRVRTNFGEYPAAPRFGANLLHRLGEPLNERNITLVREQVAESLFLDRRFRGHKVEIAVFPANRETLGIVVGLIPQFSTEQSTATEVAFLMNFTSGTVEAINV